MPRSPPTPASARSSPPPTRRGPSPAPADETADLAVFAPTGEAFGALATSLGFADAGAMVEGARRRRLQLTDAAADVAGVTTPDVVARNGVIHVIDKVLLPPM